MITITNVLISSTISSGQEGIWLGPYGLENYISLSLSLSLSHTHTHTAFIEEYIAASVTPDPGLSTVMLNP